MCVYFSPFLFNTPCELSLPKNNMKKRTLLSARHASAAIASVVAVDGGRPVCNELVQGEVLLLGVKLPRDGPASSVRLELPELLL